MKEYAQELDFAKQLALQAGEIMRKYFLNEEMKVQEKSDKTLVTLADIEINSLVIQKISEVFPGHSVWGEEEKNIHKGSTFTWVCDPVDGTMPFAKGLPISTFSLALVDSTGTPVLGVVYDPVFKRLYSAVHGQGAFLNDSPIRVSEKNTLDLAYIDYELWINEEEGVSFDDPHVQLASKGTAKITTLCSVCMTGSLVAEGQYEAVIFGQSHPEDIAAIKVIVEEAGGKVTDLIGREQRYDQSIYGAVVSNGLIHDELVSITSNMNYVSKQFLV